MTTEFTILDGEVFIDVKGFEGRYKISNHGRLMSIGGKTKKPNLSGTKDCFGYRVAMLNMKPKRETIRIHTLVARAFLPNPENKCCVNHIDGNKSNNHVSNLEWVTFKENSEHAVRTGLFDKKGAKHHNAKLTEAQVLEMRRLAKSGLTHTAIAPMFGVCRRQATDIINGVNWGWLTTG